MPDRALRSALLTCALTLIASHAAAETFCVQLRALSDAVAASTNETDLPRLRDAESCNLTRLLGGGRDYVCRWPHPYQTGAARSAFAKLDRTVQDCLPTGTRPLHDQPVNHPDFYDQRTYPNGETEIALSLKEKSALRLTYISLHIRTASPP